MHSTALRVQFASQPAPSCHCQEPSDSISAVSYQISNVTLKTAVCVRPLCKQLGCGCSQAGHGVINANPALFSGLRVSAGKRFSFQVHKHQAIKLPSTTMQQRRKDCSATT